MKLMLCRIGWMDRYDGTEDLYAGRMKWDELDAAKYGGLIGCGEAWNFLPGPDGIVRGFAMLTAKNSDGEYSGTINIDRLGANNQDDSIDGICVIFYGPKPGSDDNFVVGWYENARVHRKWRQDKRENAYGNNQFYSFEVKDTYFLVPTDERHIRIIGAVYAKSQGIEGSYPGQACVFFGSSNPEYVDDIVRQLVSKKVPKVADELASVGRGFHSRGWVLGTSGNFSAVLSRKPLRLAITSSSVDKGGLKADHILQIDGAGNVLEGDGRSSAETQLHLAVVRLREAGAVLHTHSVWSNILSDAYAADGGLSIEGYEMLKGLEGVSTHEHSEWLPIIENSQDMTMLAGSVAQALTEHPGAHGFLLRRHGLYTWGKDIAEAKRHIEILEFLLEVRGRTHRASR